MAQNSHQSQNDRRLKKINDYARHQATKANENSKKDDINSNKLETQMKL